MNSETALLSATLSGDEDLVMSLLEQGVNPNCKDEYGRGPLLSFYPKIIKLLLKYGAKPNDQFNENGHSVLAGLSYANSIFRSKGTSQLECIKLLVNSGADIEFGYAPSKESPLHHATASMGNENFEVIKFLLENQANPNAKTIPNISSHNFYDGAKTKGETALHRAAAFCSLKTIKLLLDYGATKNTLDVNGDTPLSWACWYRRPKELIEVLRCNIIP